jgi:hypothetical protein
MSERIRGQENFILITKNGQLEDRIDSITEFEYTVELETQEENFLGETQPRFDSIGKGTSIRIAGQLANEEFFALQQALVEVAERRTGTTTQIDIGSSYVFPNGETVNLAFRNVFFGAVPVTTGSREDFITWNLEGKCQRVERVV